MPELRKRRRRSCWPKLWRLLCIRLAIERDEPLLYKGDDFKHSDVRSALNSA
jgi:hypothetical protein